jgi:DNA repair protein RecO (recombination protein O)
MAGPEKTDALVLKTQKWSETSKIAHLYTRKWGRISILAKGALRPKAKFWGHLETFSLIEAMVYRKSSDQLQLLSQCLLRDAFGGLYAEPERAGYGFAAVEFLERHTFEEGNETLFDWTVFNFGLWQKLTGHRLALGFYEYLLVALGHLGYQPAIERCRICGREPGEGRKVMFDREGGGLICRRCAVEGSRYQVLSPGAYQRIKNVVKGSIQWDNGTIPPPAEVGEIIEVTESFYGYHLGGGRLKALEFVRRVAGPNARP